MYPGPGHLEHILPRIPKLRSPKNVVCLSWFPFWEFFILKFGWKLKFDESSRRIKCLCAPSDELKVQMQCQVRERPSRESGRWFRELVCVSSGLVWSAFYGSLPEPTRDWCPTLEHLTSSACLSSASPASLMSLIRLTKYFYFKAFVSHKSSLWTGQAAKLRRHHTSRAIN